MVDLSGWFLLPVIRFTASIDSNETESSSPFILHWEARLISHSSVWHWHHIVITTEGSSKNFLPTCFQIWLWAHFQKDHFYFLGKFFLSPNSVWVWYIYIYYAYFICLPSYRGRQMMPFPLAERAALCRVFQALHVLMAHTLLLPRQSHFKSISLLTLLWIPQVHCPIPLPMLLLQIASHMLTSEWMRPTLIQILAPQ